MGMEFHEWHESAYIKASIKAIYSDTQQLQCIKRTIVNENDLN